jgi:hypothetical protein
VGAPSIAIPRRRAAGPQRTTWNPQKPEQTNWNPTDRSTFKFVSIGGAEQSKRHKLRPIGARQSRVPGGEEAIHASMAHPSSSRRPSAPPARAGRGRRPPPPACDDGVRAGRFLPASAVLAVPPRGCADGARSGLGSEGIAEEAPGHAGSRRRGMNGNPEWGKGSSGQLIGIRSALNYASEPKLPVEPGTRAALRELRDRARRVQALRAKGRCALSN